MIKLEDFEEYNTLPFYYPNGDFFGDLNDFQTIQLRLYIIENKISGFYCVENSIKNFINLNGDFENGYPNCLEQDLKFLHKLIKLNIPKL